MDAQQQPLTSILEMAEQAGWATGLVTTVPMAHATPAVFAAHYPDRSELPEIARQMIFQGVDVLLGGGEDDFFSKDENGCFPGNGNQPKGSGLVGPAIQQGYSYVCNREELLSVDTAPGTQLLGLFAADEMPSPIFSDPGRDDPDRPGDPLTGPGWFLLDGRSRADRLGRA